MSRFQERREDYKNAFLSLSESLKEELTDGLNETTIEVIIDSVLHRYEFTFELAWKTIKDYLEYMGVMEKTGSPREVIQQGFKQGIIENGEIWIEMMLARNELSNLYDEQSSRKIYNNIKNKYIIELEKLYKKFKQIL